MAVSRRRSKAEIPQPAQSTLPEDEDERVFRLDARRKQVRLPPVKKMADVLSTLLARTGLAKVMSGDGLAAGFKSCVAERLAGHVRVGSVKRGVLEVLVRNSAVMQELTFEKQNILKKLAAGSVGSSVTDIRFRVGAVE